MLGFALCLAALAASTVRAGSPVWATSDYANELAGKVLADTPMGQVTALDVLIFDAQNEKLLQLLPPDTLLILGSLEGEYAVPKVRGVIDKMVTLWSIGQSESGWAPSPGFQRVSAFTAAHAVWNETAIQPQIRILTPDIERYYLEHAQDYYNRRVSQARYIFIAAPEFGAQTHKAEDLLEAIRRRVSSGRTKFEDEARQYSQADSAQNGGLLPPFENGTYFADFERRVYQLEKPGDLSSIFFGPGGLYMIQLVENGPVRNVTLTEAEAGIRAQLAHDHARQYHLWSITRLRAMEKVFNYAGWWLYLDPKVTIAGVNAMELARDDYFSFYPDPNSVSYRVDLGAIFANVDDWIDGEIAMQELEKTGAANHPWILRAKELGALRPRADRAMAARIPMADYSVKALTEDDLERHPLALENLRQAHLVEFMMEVREHDGDLPSAVRAARRLAGQHAAWLGEGSFHADPYPVNLTEWVAGIAPGSLDGAIAGLQEQANQLGNDQFAIRISDFGWVNTLPGSGWDFMLANRGPGQTSDLRAIGTRQLRYLIVETKPIDLAALSAQPLVIQEVLYTGRQKEIFMAEWTQLKNEGEIQYRH